MAEKSPSLATQAYETIKENIMNLTYPPGMVLTEAMLTKELGMSRSPIRTAIQNSINVVAVKCLGKSNS